MEHNEKISGDEILLGQIETHADSMHYHVKLVLLCASA